MSDGDNQFSRNTHHFPEGVEDFYLKSPKPLGSIGHALTRELSSYSDL